MATPHIGGIATLLLAAAPSLGVADYQTEDHDHLESLYFNETAKGIQFDDWEDRNESRVHEVELILELTSHYDLLRNSWKRVMTTIPAMIFQRNATFQRRPIGAMIGG